MKTPASPRPAHRSLRIVLLAKALVGIVLGAAFAAAFWLESHGVTLGEYTTELRRGSDPRFEWRSINRRHWQALAPGAAQRLVSEEPPERVDAREGNGAGCPSGMVRIAGRYLLGRQGESTGEVERIQDAACTEWISRDFPARCHSFDREKILRDVAPLPTRPVDFCMDRFEYPNVLGQNPVIVVTYREAEALCKSSSKRLCNESEWTFACEGEEGWPYPYGFTRDATSCVVDRAWRPFAENALSPRDGAQARAELDRLWQGEPSGSRGGCKSPFGVYDMTGNVDEWTRTVRSTGYSSILKGGYWGPVRARCRPATRAHNEDFVAYQQGFRCCAEADRTVAAPRPRTPDSLLASLGDGGGSGRDAGAPRVEASAEARAYDLPTAREILDSDGDELEALARARVGLRCSTLGAPALAARSGVWAPLVIFFGAALVTRRRQRTRAQRRPRCAANASAAARTTARGSAGFVM